MHSNEIAAFLVTWAGFYPARVNPARVSLIRVEIGELHNNTWTSGPNVNRQLPFGEPGSDRGERGIENC